MNTNDKIWIECECLLCGYKWLPRSMNRPKTCARCKRHDWDKPKKEEKESCKEKNPRTFKWGLDLK